MNLRVLGSFAALCLSATACHGQTTGSPVAASVGGESKSTSITSTPLAGVSPPATSAPNPRVASTTFDGCAVVTDAEAASWGADPAQKHDLADGMTAKYESTRGCYWRGSVGQLRVYATNGTLTNFDQPDKAYDLKKQVQFGSRQGWVGRDAPPYAGCSAFVESQQGIAVVQLVGGPDAQDAHTDLCPTAIEVMQTIEPRIP